MKSSIQCAQGLMNERASIPAQVQVNAQVSRRTGHQCKDDLCRYCTLSENDGVRLEAGAIFSFGLLANLMASFFNSFGDDLGRQVERFGQLRNQALCAFEITIH